MAYIITIAQQKGGAGKTSLAAHLAATWSSDKDRRVALFDLDPQKSLTHWFHVRSEKLAEGNTMTLWPSQGWRLAAELTRAKREADVIVIDCPGKDDLGTRVAVRAADIVVMPVQPSPIDVWASKPTLELIAKEGTPALIVLNRLPGKRWNWDAILFPDTTKRPHGPTPQFGDWVELRNVTLIDANLTSRSPYAPEAWRAKKGQDSVLALALAGR